LRADGLLSTGGLWIDVQGHLARGVEVAAQESNLDLLSPLAAEREDRLDIGNRARVETVGITVAPAVFIVAESQDVLAVLRRGEKEQAIEAEDIFAAGQFAAFRI